VALSLSMPLGTPSYPASRIVPFLEGLLPDNAEVRETWARRFGVSPRNAFALLSHIGRDCAGAVEFVAGDLLDFVADTSPLSDEQIGQRLRDLAKDPVGWQVSGERWSLAGAQSKFTLARLPSGEWCEMEGVAPSTHIIKPGIGEYRDQALVEHLSMQAARAVGLRAAKTEFREFDGEPALVITRFDRRRARDGSIVRVHQEDMCQALAVYPRKKYEASGGPTTADIARLLRDNSTDGEADVWEFAQALLFNYLIGAPDAHAKNYSIMHAPGLTRITPLYDVASALPYDAVGDSEINQAAMSIGGKRVFGTVHGRHWDRLAKGLGVDAGRLRDEIRRQAAAIPAAFEALLDQADAAVLRDRLMPELEHLGAATVTQLSD
jgi:serine/threonine-protein kinase HipA